MITHLQANEFDSFLKPFFSQNCTKCHGDKKVKGKVNLKEIQSLEQFMAKPEMIKEMIDVMGIANQNNKLVEAYGVEVDEIYK